MGENIYSLYEEMAIISKTFGTIGGVLIIMYGLVLLTRKKILIHNFYFASIVFFSLLVPNIIELFLMGEMKIIIFLLMPIILFLFYLGRREYTINNMNKQMATSTLKDILDERNISYEITKYKIILKDYDKHIWYHQSLDSVQISFRHISKFDFYPDLKTELKKRIKDIDTKLFPWSGIIYISIGIILIVFS